MTQRVLITGAAQGLGASLVAAFREREARVLATDLSGADFTLDVTSDADWQRARDHVDAEWGGLDVLVNNAGIALGGRFDRDSMSDWERSLQVNLLGAVRGMKTFFDVFKHQRSGHIVNIASLAGLVHPAGMGAYVASKAGLVGASESVGHELAGWGVRVMTVCPSFFRTDLVRHSTSSDPTMQRVMERLVDQAPFGPDEIAAAIVGAMDRGDELVLPDPEAQVAYDLKVNDRYAYDALMRDQAAKLEATPVDSAHD